MAVRRGDFVEIEYTGKLKDGNIVFDTTKEEVAKKNKIYDEKSTYKPLIVCVGEGHIVRGLDKEIEGKEVGKKLLVDVSPEEGFGKKNPKLLQLISTNKFREQKISPVPGMQVNVDGLIGTIKTVTGGRTIIDFNHPLSGKELVYEVEIKRTVADAKEKVNAVIDLMRLKGFEIEIKEKEKTLTLKTKHDIPEEIEKKIGEEIKRLVKEIEKVEIKKTEKKEEKKKEGETKPEKKKKETRKEGNKASGKTKEDK